MIPDVPAFRLASTSWMLLPIDDTTPMPVTTTLRIDSGGAFGNGVGVGIRKNDTELQKAFNKAINQARKNGDISRIATKWFGFDASM